MWYLILGIVFSKIENTINPLKKLFFLLKTKGYMMINTIKNTSKNTYQGGRGLSEKKRNKTITK